MARLHPVLKSTKNPAKHPISPPTRPRATACRVARGPGAAAAPTTRATTSTRGGCRRDRRGFCATRSAGAGRARLPDEAAAADDLLEAELQRRQLLAQEVERQRA